MWPAAAEALRSGRRNAAYLSERLGEIEAVETPYAVHSYYKYICRLRAGGLSLGSRSSCGRWGR